MVCKEIVASGRGGRAGGRAREKRTSKVGMRNTDARLRLEGGGTVIRVTVRRLQPLGMVIR